MFLCGVLMLWLLQRFPVAGTLLPLAEIFLFHASEGWQKGVLLAWVPQLWRRGGVFLLVTGRFAESRRFIILRLVLWPRGCQTQS